MGLQRDLSAPLSFGDLRIDGRSRAGEATWVRVRPPGIALDVGRGAVELVGCPALFLSHGHLDHSLGVPFLLAHRTLSGLGSTRIHCPREIAGAIEDLIAVGGRLEDEELAAEVVGLEVGDRVELDRDWVVETFATDHRVPSLGYHLLQRRRRLRPELRGLSGDELAALRRDGETLDEVDELRRLSYCGDTGPGVFDLAPEIFESEILMVELTFVDPEHLDKARRFHHLHLKDLEARKDRLANRALVLYHGSRRYSDGAYRRAVAEGLEGMAPSLAFLPGDG